MKGAAWMSTVHWGTTYSKGAVQKDRMVYAERQVSAPTRFSTNTVCDDWTRHELQRTAGRTCADGFSRLLPSDEPKLLLLLVSSSSLSSSLLLLLLLSLPAPGPEWLLRRATWTHRTAYAMSWLTIQ